MSARLPFKGARDWVNRAAQRLEDAPARLFSGGRPVTASAQRELFEKGVPGTALVVEAPARTFVHPTKDSVGKFTVTVELSGRAPYRAELWHSFDAQDWELLQPGTRVQCRVDPDRPHRVLLIPRRT